MSVHSSHLLTIRIDSHDDRLRMSGDPQSRDSLHGCRCGKSVVHASQASG